MAEGNDGLASELAKVVAKNTELLTEMRALKDANKKFDGIDIEALQAASEKLQEVEDAKKKEVGEFKTLYEQELKKSGDLSSKLSTAEQSGKELEKRLDIVQVLPNVDPDFRDIAIQEIASQVDFDDAGNPVGNGKPLKDFVADWSETPRAKKMILAPDNSGGGAGGSGGGSPPDPLLAAFKKGDPGWNMTTQGQLRRSDPERAKKLEKLAAKG